MSRNAQVTLDWADGTYPFALKIDQLAELQDRTGAGPWYIQWALEAALMARALGVPPPKDASPAYVIETIRLGLIGGGMEAIAALKKVRDYVGPGQINENIQTAFAIIGVALQGVPEDEPEKPEAGDGTSSNLSPAGASASPSSSAQAQPSG
ncbi:gene transfer agent family protein [Paracoccus tibetensis]|uniref:Phage tail tube protein, GTA-gp10 n=1 Tax=Paracoccus tibetensis TaxID=336292 RepID=A0A1G5BE50_9RHOB|nr:gene transfer agent family protein [Paracoccus tibetensis]SCX88407.1 Phage tail tube protein, GTA-gp10 [Paracoccus tibetensis]